MRRITFVLVMLALAAAACICVGPTTAPDLQPLATTAPTSAPNTQATPLPRATVDPNATEITPIELEQIMLSAVEILAGEVVGGQFQPQWGGSGTIISPDGEIVTNCHVACGMPSLMILMTSDPDQPPEPRFFAELVSADEDIDLAILRLTTDIDGNPVSSPNLPYVPLGNSDDLLLGDKLYIFGYPSFEGATETITFTTGTVSGFESTQINGSDQRFWIKTDATIFHGNSGGTAVDIHGRLVAVPTGTFDIRQGVEVGGINLLKPINLVDVVRAGGNVPQVSAPSTEGSDPDPYEPNDDLEHAAGPMQPGETIEAYISWDQDVDLFFIDTNTSQPITVQLEGPSGTDYDIGLVDEGGNVLAKSENESSSESFTYSPVAAGRYWILIVSYSGASASQSYQLSVAFDGGVAGSTGGGGEKGSGGISISGQVIDGSTGNPLVGGQFGLLESGVTCASFFTASTLDSSLIVSAAETNSQGYFTLTGVPTGVTYAAYFVHAALDPICEDGWLDVPSGQGDSDIGPIEITP